MKKITLYFTSIVLGALVIFGTTQCSKDKVPEVTSNNCSDTIRFSTQIMPLIQNNCISCHDAGLQAPALTNHAEISANATQIYNSLNGQPVLMPSGGPALADSLIQQMNCWIQQGKPNN
jgi:hypothetical protein